ncbi:MAG: hypothetical protein ACYDHD_00235 [Vulcanimicrobiaceae bacterium]
MDTETLQHVYEAWCRQIAEKIAQTEPQLAYAHNNDDPGNFKYQARFVNLSVMQDGRVLIDGLAAEASPLVTGQPIPPAPQLFPGGTAMMLSMNDEGAELAGRAIVAWLLEQEEQLAAIRTDARKHEARTLR